MDEFINNNSDEIKSKMNSDYEILNPEFVDEHTEVSFDVVEGKLAFNLIYVEFDKNDICTVAEPYDTYTEYNEGDNIVDLLFHLFIENGVDIKSDMENFE